MSEENTAPAGQKPPDMREIMQDYDKAVKFISETPAEIWETLGQKAAMNIYQEAFEKIPAYKDFLKKNVFDSDSVKSIDDFKKIPIADKENYYKLYSFNETNSAHAGDHLYSFSLSSGTTDIPTIWPRFYGQEDSAEFMIGLFMRLYWGIDQKKTFLINAANLGVYTSGILIHGATRPLSKKYNMTLATTGSDLENIVHSVKLLSEYYDQTVIITYPTFIRTIIDRLSGANIDIKKLNLKIFVSGEGHTIEWRRYMNSLMGAEPDNLTSIIDGYGTSELGNVFALGTPMCNLIRILCTENKELNAALFNQGKVVPTLHQYNPGNVYIESHNNETIFTSRGGTPLVRYNIHDRGGVISFREMERILEKHNIDYKSELMARGVRSEMVWQQPFVYCYGRRQDTIIIGGGNVYPEQIEPAIINNSSDEVHSFKLKMLTDAEQHQRMCIMLELKQGLSADEKKVNLYHDLILEHLLKINADYAISYRSDPEFCDPVVEIFEYRKGPFEGDELKVKPRLVLE